MVREKLYDQLECIVDPEHPQAHRLGARVPAGDWERDINAAVRYGVWLAIARLLPVIILSPAQQGARHRGLYFVGQGTYPGIGMPMVSLLSARLLQERLAKDYRL